jgi:hypothetical protein
LGRKHAPEWQPLMIVFLPFEIWISKNVTHRPSQRFHWGNSIAMFCFYLSD